MDAVQVVKARRQTQEAFQDTNTVCSLCQSSKFPPVKAAALGHKVCLQLIARLDRNLAYATDYTGASPLHAALRSGQLLCADYLLDEMGADLLACDSTGGTIAHHAAYHGQLDALKWIAARNKKILLQNAKDGATPVHFAAAKGHLSCLQYLILEGGANPSEVDENGTTPLYFAAQEGHLPCVLWLATKANADPFIEAHDGMCSLHAAAQAGRYDVLKFLVENTHKKIGWFQDRDGATPVHFAAAKGHKECLLYLLNHGGSGNEKDRALSTPVHDAAEQGQLDSLRILAAHGTNLAQQDIDGYTPEYLAYQRHHFVCCAFLRESAQRVKNRLLPFAYSTSPWEPSIDLSTMEPPVLLHPKIESHRPSVAPPPQRTPLATQQQKASSRDHDNELSGFLSDLDRQAEEIKKMLEETSKDSQSKPHHPKTTTNVQDVPPRDYDSSSATNFGNMGLAGGPGKHPIMSRKSHDHHHHPHPSTEVFSTNDSALFQSNYNHLAKIKHHEQSLAARLKGPENSHPHSSSTSPPTADPAKPAEDSDDDWDFDDEPKTSKRKSKAEKKKSEVLAALEKQNKLPLQEVEEQLKSAKKQEEKFASELYKAGKNAQAKRAKFVTVNNNPKKSSVDKRHAEEEAIEAERMFDVVQSEYQKFYLQKLALEEKQKRLKESLDPKGKPAPDQAAPRPSLVPQTKSGPDKPIAPQKTDPPPAGPSLVPQPPRPSLLNAVQAQKPEQVPKLDPRPSTTANSQGQPQLSQLTPPNAPVALSGPPAVPHSQLLRSQSPISLLQLAKKAK